MEKEQLEEALRIRYVKLHVRIQFREDTWLPMNKVSAIRGGIGEMLLRANCIRNRDCTSCDFEQECIVRRTLYSKFERKPAFVTKGDSVGYVLECENYEEQFYAGSILGFQLILFGKTIVYFAQFLQAIYQLGFAGLGGNHSQYDVVSIKNTKGTEILDGPHILMKHYEILFIGDYVRYRLAQKEEWEGNIRFQSPTTLKYQGNFLKNLSIEAVISAVLRRIYILDCFEGMDCQEMRWEKEYPRAEEEHSQMITVYRYSGTQDQKIALRGVKGDLLLEELSQDLLPVLLAGEILHIGKNTSFGFGRYRIE